MDPEWQAKNLDLYFSGINPNCPRKSTSVLDKDSKKHDGTLIRINKKDQLEFNTKKSILASEWTLSIEDFFGTKV